MSRAAPKIGAAAARTPVLRPQRLARCERLALLLGARGSVDERRDHGARRDRPRDATARRARTCGSGSSIASGSSSKLELPLTTQAISQLIHALVVVGLGRMEHLPGRPRRQRALLERHIVVGTVEGAEHAPVFLVAEALRQVLHERATESDVDQLHPAADPQQRQVALDRRTCQCDLERIARGNRVDGLADVSPARRSPGRCRLRRRGSVHRSARAPARGRRRATGRVAAGAPSHRHAARLRRS